MLLANDSSNCNQPDIGLSHSILGIQEGAEPKATKGQGGEMTHNMTNKLFKIFACLGIASVIAACLFVIGLGLIIIGNYDSTTTDIPTQAEVNELAERCDNEYGQGNWTFWACHHGCSQNPVVLLT